MRATTAKKGGGAWWLSDATALVKAQDVGVGPAHHGESKATWHGRIQASIDNGGTPPAARQYVSPGVGPKPDEPPARAAMPEDAREALRNLARKASVPKHLGASSMLYGKPR
jgi:hypothetical protein